MVHVAVEAEEDLDGVNLHLQGAGQVHHLSHTHTTSVRLFIVSSVHPVCARVATVPCAPAAAGRPPVRTRTAGCARRRPAPAGSPRSPPAAPSGGTIADLKHKQRKRNISLIHAAQKQAEEEKEEEEKVVLVEEED